MGFGWSGALGGGVEGTSVMLSTIKSFFKVTSISTIIKK